MSSRNKAANPDAPDLSGPLWALLPSVEQLRQLGAVDDTGARAPGGTRVASLDIPPDLLNALGSLPRPLSLDDAKELARVTGTAPGAQAR